MPPLRFRISLRCALATLAALAAFMISAGPRALAAPPTAADSPTSPPALVLLPDIPAAPVSSNPQHWPAGDRSGDIDWANVGNDKGGLRYSTLDQINRSNVKQLEVAWRYKTGDASPKSTIECTPIVIGGVMYITTVRANIVALNAATGAEIWRFDPTGLQPKIRSAPVNRGVAYWSDGKPEGARRILAGVGYGYLISLDAKTGIPDPAFGKGGQIDLRVGLESFDFGNYHMTSPPAIFEDLVICGMRVDEGLPSAPGDLRAFDVRTGKQVWRFHTVPQPGEFGHETWEADSWKNSGGVNPWGGLTVDAEQGIVFGGIGSPAPDFFGGKRKGDNLFGNCVLALDARTGERRWHFQTIRHDLWDRDIPCPPVVIDLKQPSGEVRPVVAQVTKQGFCFVLDRNTGESLFPIEERPAPASDIPGERAATTQPWPVKPPPISSLGWSDDDITNVSPESHEFVRKQVEAWRRGELYLPPSAQGSICNPGLHGGANWSGASADPETGLLYVNSNNWPMMLKLVPNDADYRDGYGPGIYDNQFFDQDGLPPVKPPWGLLTAIDLNKGEFAWQIPLGEWPEAVAKGYRNTGSWTFGGTIVTAGGLVFIAGTRDEKLHAYDKATGDLLWEGQLKAGGYATPCTYAVDGKQYVAIAAGGGGKIGSKEGDEYVVFALK